MARRLTNIKRVCVVGAGPSAIGAVKFLLAENCLSKIDVFDQRSETAGVWQWEPENDAPPRYPVPHAEPDVPLEKPIWRGKAQKRATYQSPVYERLEANIPKMLMQHSDYDFAEAEPLFPSRQTILEYLDRYANDVRHLVKFDTQVTHVDLTSTEPDVWNVTTEDLRSGIATQREYDAVLVSSGHYQIPFVPDYEGIAEFNEQHPGVIVHSKYFNSPEDYRGKNVLVIGHGPSGSDISTQIAARAAHLHVSTRSEPKSPIPPTATPRPAICAFDAATRSVTFTDDSTLQVDAVLFCTGYLYSYAFLSDRLRRDLDPPRTGARVHGTYRHLFAARTPTLAFTCLPWNIVPFPLAEAQGAAVARAWAGRLALPDAEEMRKWEAERVAAAGDGKVFHRLAPPGDVEYLNELYEWSRTADGEDAADWDRSGRSRPATRVGRIPPYWDGRMRWLRCQVPRIKAAYAAKGEERHAVRTLEDLGFVYPGDETNGVR